MWALIQYDWCPYRKSRLGQRERYQVMPKARPLCTSAKSNLRDRVLGEVEKNSFIALPGKGGHSRLVPLKIMCPNLGKFGEVF